MNDGKANGNIVRNKASVHRARRRTKNRHGSYVLWFTGFSGAGKSSLAHAVEEQLYGMGFSAFVLDGDNVRNGICGDLGFSHEDRKENIRRIGEVSKLFVDAGIITLVALISPFQKDREWVRQLLGHDDFIEIYCKASLEACEKRDVKGIYKKAREGIIKNFTGISSPYEEPESPEIILNTEKTSLEESAQLIMDYLKTNGYLQDPPTS